MRQDLAVVVPEEVPAAEVEETIWAAAKDLLYAVDIFDVYRGEQIDEGTKSLAMNLEFCSGERTLTDEEVAEARQAIKTKLDEIGGSLRE